MTFDMSIGEHFASFFDPAKDRHIFVESFDNEVFEVRIGTVDDSEFVVMVTAISDEELNTKIMTLYKTYQCHQG